MWVGGWGAGGSIKQLSEVINFYWGIGEGEGVDSTKQLSVIVKYVFFFFGGGGGSTRQLSEILKFLLDGGGRHKATFREHPPPPKGRDIFRKPGGLQKKFGSSFVPLQTKKAVSFSFYLVVLEGSTFRIEGVGATHKELTIILPGNHSYVILTFLLQNIKITGLTLGKVY